MDLEIDHYSLDDLLKLFKLKHNFTQSEFKESRKIVLATHPDKSGLDKEYFLFFSKAYEMLSRVNDIRNQSQKTDINTHSTHDQLIDAKDVQKEKIVDKLSKSKDFNKTFNELFEKYYIPEENDGYGEWMKKEDEEITFEKRKKESRELTKMNNIKSSNHWNGIGSSLGNSTSSFHTSNYSDLKQIYTTDSVLGVSEDDYVEKYKNLDDLIKQRTTVKPMEEHEAMNVFSTQEEMDRTQDTKRLFNLVQQDEKNKLCQQKFWSHLLTLK